MPQDDKNYLIFIHGFLGGERNFRKMRERASHAGYHVILEEYDTLDGGVKYHTETFVSGVMKKARGAKRIDIITHSMGALLLRQYLAEHRIANLARVVMIAPVNHGSEVADQMSQYDWWVSMFGQAGLDLRTKMRFPAMPDDVELGVIAGTTSYNYLSKGWIEGDDDGWVGVESTKLDGMADYIEAECSHGTLTNNQSVIDQSFYFLQNGHFASNITMEGNAIGFSDLEDFRQSRDEYVDKINKWYRDIFDAGDEKAIEDARPKLREKFAEYNQKFLDWQDKFMD